MDNVFLIVVLVVAVTCVMVATQPARPATRRRIRASQPTGHSAPAASRSKPEYRWGDTQRWSRRDIQQAIARDHAFPTGESVWPPR